MVSTSQLCQDFMYNLRCISFAFIFALSLLSSFLQSFGSHVLPFPFLLTKYG